MTNLSIQAARLQDDCDDTLGGRLSMARDAASIDLSTLANRLGVRKETLQSWEADRAEPRASRLVNLAGILGVSPMWLMTGAGEGPREDEVARPPLEAMRLQLLRLTELHREHARLIDELTRQISLYEKTEVTRAESIAAE